MEVFLQIAANFVLGLLIGMFVMELFLRWFLGPYN